MNIRKGEELLALINNKPLRAEIARLQREFRAELMPRGGGEGEEEGMLVSANFQELVLGCIEANICK